MKKHVFLTSILFTTLLAGCAIYAPGPPVVEVAPPLPAVVEFETEPVYVYHGYYYFYDNGGWAYSRSREGSRFALPRERWPHETRWKGRGGEGGEHGRDRDRD